MARIAHPLVDHVRDGVLLTRAESAVVRLSPLRADLLATTVRERRAAVLVTGPDARLTEPMRFAAREARWGWAVEAPSGWFDGWSGRPVAAPEQVLEIADEPWTPDPTFLRAPSAPIRQLLVSASFRHRPAATTEVGRVVEAAASAAGHAPVAWGPHEPAERTWGVDGFTAFARSSAQAPSRMVVAGPPATVVGSVLVQRTDQGVEEQIELVLAAGSAESEDHGRSVRLLVEQLRRFPVPLSAVVLERVGEADLTRPPLLHRAEPRAVLIGAPVIRDLGLDATALAAEHGGEVIGHPRVPGLLVLPEDDGWETLGSLIGRIGERRLADVVRRAPREDRGGHAG